MSNARHTWSLDERHFLHVARTETDLSLADLTRMFAQAFNDLWPNGTPGEFRLRDEYESRLLGGRSKMWERDIERKKYNATQEQAREQARDNIRSAAKALGITVPWKTPTSSTSAPAAPVTRVPRPSATANPLLPSSNSATAPVANTRKRQRAPPSQRSPKFQGGLSELKDTDNLTSENTRRSSRARPRKPQKGSGEEKVADDNINSARAIHRGEIRSSQDRVPGVAPEKVSSVAQNAPGNGSHQAIAASDQIKPTTYYGGIPSDRIGPHLRNLLDRQARLRAAAPTEGIADQTDSPRLTLSFTGEEKRDVANAISNFAKNEQSETLSDSPAGQSLNNRIKEAPPLVPDAFSDLVPVDGIPVAWQTRLARKLARITTPEQREHMTRMLDLEIQRRHAMAEEGDHHT